MLSHTIFDPTSMGNHRRNYRCQIRNQHRIMFFHQVNNCRAACHNNIVHLTLIHQTHILPGDNGRPFRRLTHLGKTKLQQCRYNLPGIFIIQQSTVGRIQGNHHMFTFLQHIFYIIQITVKSFCLLRTDFHTVSTVNTHIGYDLRLSLFDSDGLDITVS